MSAFDASPAPDLSDRSRVAGLLARSPHAPSAPCRPGKADDEQASDEKFRFHGGSPGYCIDDTAWSTSVNNIMPLAMSSGDFAIMPM